MDSCAISDRAKVSRAWLFYYSHKRLAIALAVVFAVALATLLVVDLAYAGWFEDKLFNPGIDGALKAAGENLSSISVSSVTNSFNDLFVGTGAYDAIMKVQDSLVKSLAYGVLAIVMLVQLVRIANRLDGAAAVPGVKEVIFLLFFFVIIKFVIDHSVDFCAAFYDGVTQFVKSIDYDPDLSLANTMSRENLGLDGFTGLVMAGLIIMPISVIAVVVGYFVVIARNLQLYIYAVFACVPLALLGCEETKQYGVGFIKNFAALCLTGIIIVLILIMYPLITQSVVNENTATGAGLWAPQLAVSFLFVFSMVKSGSWARDVLGG